MKSYMRHCSVLEVLAFVSRIYKSIISIFGKIWISGSLSCWLHPSVGHAHLQFQHPDSFDFDSWKWLCHCVVEMYNFSRVDGGQPMNLTSEIALCGKNATDQSRGYDGQLSQLIFFNSSVSATQVDALYRIFKVEHLSQTQCISSDSVHSKIYCTILKRSIGIDLSMRLEANLCYCFQPNQCVRSLFIAEYKLDCNSSLMPWTVTGARRAQTRGMIFSSK